jgi:hypothetical protein
VNECRSGRKSSVLETTVAYPFAYLAIILLGATDEVGVGIRSKGGDEEIGESDQELHIDCGCYLD